MFDFLTSIFFKKYRFISKEKALKKSLNFKKYAILEFVIDANEDLGNHLINAIRINILQYESCLMKFDANQTLFLNNNPLEISWIHTFLKNHFKKVLFIKKK